MTPESDAKLRAAYPLVFQYPLMNDEPIRCGEGWFHLLWLLCGGLQETIEEVGFAALDHSDPQAVADFSQWRAVQVKEKFGALRLYLHRETSEMTTLLDLAERLSQHVCDVCGKPGKQRSGDAVERPMLVRTRCDEHVNWFEAETGFAHQSK